MKTSESISPDLGKILGQHDFHPVIPIPQSYEVLDLSSGYDAEKISQKPFAIGRYNEPRRNMYTSAHFNNQRFIHMGIDLWCPVGTPVHTFAEGRIYATAYNHHELDYGATIVTEHTFESLTLYALFGHVTLASLRRWKTGQHLQRGALLTEVGDTHENGGWAPHLHFQISLLKPEKADMPGVVSPADLQEALRVYPDPQLILGRLYD